MMECEIFDLEILIPAGNYDPRLKAKLEKNAKEKLFSDIQTRGYVPIPESFSVLWHSSYQGTVSVMGTPRRINGEL
jgi:hypothetical protein